jgi:hypothetical protein
VPFHSPVNSITNCDLPDTIDTVSQIEFQCNILPLLSQNIYSETSYEIRDMVDICKCCDVDLSNEFNVVLLSEFKKIPRNDVEKQKQFVNDLLSFSCDDECFNRCFQISESRYLCRTGLSRVLKLSRRVQKAIVPSSKFIYHRYHIICITEIFSALVSYRTLAMQKWPTRRDRTYAERVDWSHPCFAEAKKKSSSYTKLSRSWNCSFCFTNRNHCRLRK